MLTSKYFYNSSHMNLYPYVKIYFNANSFSHRLLSIFLDGIIVTNSCHFSDLFNTSKSQKYLRRLSFVTFPDMLQHLCGMERLKTLIRRKITKQKRKFLSFLYHVVQQIMKRSKTSHIVHLPIRKMKSRCLAVIIIVVVEMIHDMSLHIIKTWRYVRRVDAINYAFRSCRKFAHMRVLES